jgi:hypothetical protein
MLGGEYAVFCSGGNKQICPLFWIVFIGGEAFAL